LFHNRRNRAEETGFPKAAYPKHPHHKQTDYENSKLSFSSLLYSLPFLYGPKARGENWNGL